MKKGGTPAKVSTAPAQPMVKIDQAHYNLNDPASAEQLLDDYRRAVESDTPEAVALVALRAILSTKVLEDYVEQLNRQLDVLEEAIR